MLKVSDLRTLNLELKSLNNDHKTKLKDAFGAIHGVKKIDKFINDAIKKEVTLK